MELKTKSMCVYACRMAKMAVCSPDLTSSASWTRHFPPASQGPNSGQQDMSRSDGGHSRPGPENLPEDFPSWLDMDSSEENSGIMELADSKSLNHSRRGVSHSAMLKLDSWLLCGSPLTFVLKGPD